MDTSGYREEIYDTFAGSGDLADQVDRSLEVGTEYLDVSIGFLTRIEDGVQEIVYATGGHELIQPGETCPLEEAYCRRTVEIDSTLAVQNAAVSSAVSETAVQTFDLGTYIGARVTVDDDVYGTICFADTETRGEPFSESEELFLELLAELIGGALERRAHERELRERNERLEREKRRFEGIAETSFDVLFRLDRDAEFTYVSSAIERVLGFEPAALEGEAFSEFIVDQSIESALSAYARLLEGETIENVELDFVADDGATVVLEVNAKPITDADDVVGVQGVGRDVTARKERERELRLKNRAIDEADIGIAIADYRQPDEPLVYVNEGFERVTGYDAADALGRNCRFLQGEATDPATVDRLRERIDAGESAAVELLNYRRDGAPYWNQVRVSPVVNDAGEVTHYLGFQTDVTERKRTEQLIRLLNRVLRHNLRNEMNVLIGFGSRIREGDLEDVAPLGDRIIQTADGLMDLGEQARQLESYAKRERAPRRLETDQLLDRIAAEHRDRFPSATVDLSVRTDRGICAGEEVETAIDELVENALKHNPAVEPWVEIEAVDDGEWIELTVTDDGPGLDDIESAVISKGEETPLEHGSGLGLWLINWIVTRYGGSFQIRQTGDGTIATVRLPGIGPDESVEATARRPTVLFR